MIFCRSDVLSIRKQVCSGSEDQCRKTACPVFKRLKEGVFDEKDLIERTEELKNFIDEAAQMYGFSRENVIAAGYSNGANIAASLLFHYKDVLKGAVLHHPMVPIRGVKLPDMKGMPVFIGAGKRDPLCTKEESEELYQYLTDAHASVSLVWQEGGHQLTQQEAEQARTWYSERFYKTLSLLKRTKGFFHLTAKLTL